MAGEGSPEKKELFGYEKELEQAIKAVKEDREGKHTNVAIISEPFAGRTTLIQALAKEFPGQTTSISFNSVMTDRAFISTLHEANDIVIMDNCHFLAMRKIGGFIQLDEFLRFLSTSPKIFITTWNSFSWSYLSAVKDIQDFFPTIIRLSPMDTASIKNMILSRYNEDIEYVNDIATEGRKVSFAWSCIHFRLPYSKTEYCLPWPYIDLSRIFRKKKELDVSEIVFDRLQRASAGNPGVARKIWDNSIEFPIIKVSSIHDTAYPISLSINESYLLGIILTMESIQLGDLAEIAGPEIDVEQSLYILIGNGLVTEEKGFYTINYRALKSVIHYLELNRMVW